MGALERR